MSMFRSSVCVRVWILQRACMHVRVLCGSYHSLCPYTYMYAHETTTKLSLWVSGFNPNKATHAYTHTHTHTRTHTYTPYRWTALLSRLLSIVVLKWQSCHFLAQRSSLLMRLCACWGFVCHLNVCAPQYICTCIIGRLLATIFACAMMMIIISFMTFKNCTGPCRHWAMIVFARILLELMSRFWVYVWVRMYVCLLAYTCVRVSHVFWPTRVSVTRFLTYVH